MRTPTATMTHGLSSVVSTIAGILKKHHTPASDSLPLKVAQSQPWASLHGVLSKLPFSSHAVGVRGESA